MKTLTKIQYVLMVKIVRKYTIIFAVFISIILSLNFISTHFYVEQDVDQYYGTQLEICKEKILYLIKQAEKRESPQALKELFKDARYAYKKLAVLSEYFKPFETFSLNNPAIPRVEDDVPDIVIPPAGFQAVESILYGKFSTDEYEKLNGLLTKMNETLSKMENESGRSLMFREEFTWDALRASIIRIMANGITGFDSPLAKQSIPEATASLHTIKDLVLIFKKDHAKHADSFEKLEQKINDAIDYTINSLSKGFDKFDRLEFISRYLNPLYKQMTETRVAAGIGIPEGRYPVNFSASSIFGKDAFNINFFSPAPDYWVNAERVALGKKLFFDPVLSGNNSRSCASCHKPEKAFTDGLKTPMDIDNKISLPRNTPTLINSGLQTRQFLDSRADILENQLDEVVHNTTEMKGSLKNTAELLKKSAVYKDLFNKAYSSEINPITVYTVANAISSYVRSLISLNSRFDQYMLGDASALNETEKKGFNLFAGKAKCATCHFIPLFNGLVPPSFSETESEILGVPQTKNKKKAKLDPDEGKFKFTAAVVHKFAFKTPTLRNIELTAPYMHNGVFNTLEEVMDFYDRGGGTGLGIAPSNQTLDGEKLHLTKKEKKAIIAFMRSLTDTSYLRMP